MSDKQTSYRQILKATSIFGGVQVFNIIISLVRGKLLAVLLGANGMGLNGLLMSNLNLIRTISGLGLEQSAVREISIAYGSGDSYKVSKVYFVLRRWIWFSALLGILITIGFSTMLSSLAFGDKSHTTSYILLSSTFIFMALSGGIYTLLRGMRKLESLAKANIIGSISGLLVVIPLYYFMGIKGVVPALVLTSLVSFLVSIYFRRDVQLQLIQITWKDTIDHGKGMVFLGITLSISALFTTSIEYVLSLFIKNIGTLSDLGLYNAGMSIIGGYVGMIFTAIGMDFYPRLSAVINDDLKWRDIVFHQSELMLLILGPFLMLILAITPLLVKVLLSNEFLPVIDFIVLAIPAIILKALVWIQGFILIAKGQNKLFLITEVIESSFFLLCNMFLFNKYGLKGLGIAMALSYLFSVTLLSIVLKRKFNFLFPRIVVGFSILFTGLVLGSILGIYILDFPNAYFSGGLLFILSVLVSFFELNKRIDIKMLVKNFAAKF